MPIRKTPEQGEGPLHQWPQVVTTFVGVLHQIRPRGLEA